MTLRAFRRDFVVTADAFVDARHTGGNGPTGLNVTIQAGNLKFARVNLVAEIDGLFRASAGKERPVRPITKYHANESDNDHQAGYSKRS